MDGQLHINKGTHYQSQVPFILGTRVLLTCNVTGLDNGTEVTRYRWFYNCTRGRCLIKDNAPYYRVVDNTLLVDVISCNQGGKYTCFVDFKNSAQTHGSISNIAITGWYTQSA